MSEKGTGYLHAVPTGREFRAEELFAAPPPVVWTEKHPNNIKTYFPIRDQAQSSACVAFTMSVVLGVENLLEEGKFVELSPRMIYGRGFEPQGGMYYARAAGIAQNNGTALETLMPSEALPEDQMRLLADEKPSDRLVGQIYRGGQYIFLPTTFDYIAGILSLGKAVALGTRFDPGGFSLPEVKLKADGVYGHAVTAVDYGLMSGKKVIFFQNSWGQAWGWNGCGGIIEEEAQKGLVTAVYFTELANAQSSAPKPKLHINALSLNVGSTGADVVSLQVGLQWLGFFPSSQTATGYYGGISRAAVKLWQTRCGISPDGIANAQTINAFNQFFA